ncbi:MAG: tRNA (adenosine(37)-N6)-dimethylallyltransferase MiaA [Syntrophomonadaceae bacterium]|jgi:tRNA dimethylallyltransferase
MLNLAALVGPTAAGKTDISIALALRLNGEIISCDSMQVYKGMDIGTAKAGKYEMSVVPHHMIDIVDPDYNFTVADYQKMTKQLIKDINSRGRIPILVGGTGLYYQAVVDDYEFFPVEHQINTRNKWETICNQKGIDYLYKCLQEVDPKYAGLISSHDRKRIIRALEVFDLTGQPFSLLQVKNKDRYNLAVAGICLDRPILYSRIEERVDKMLDSGLIQEVELLRSKGYGLELKSMQSLGYKQVFCYLEGMVTYKEMIAEIKRETRRFAKRQFTWFNKDKRISWFDPNKYPHKDEFIKNISDYIEGQLYRM